MDLFGAVDAAGQRELDVGRAARPRDEARDGAGGRRVGGVPRLEEDTDLAQRLDQDAPIEDRDVDVRQMPGCKPGIVGEVDIARPDLVTPDRRDG